MVLATVTALNPEEVGVSVDPNAEAMRRVPAEAYEDLVEARVAASMSCHSTHWSAAPVLRRKERIRVL